MPGPAPFAVEPVRVFLLQRGIYAFSFSLWSVYASVRRVTELGFDPLELVLVGTVLEASVLLAEVPTGVVADLRGRRRSVAIGTTVVGLGMALETLVHAFWPVLLAQVVWGVGWTFISGARSAWLADEIGEERAAGVFLRASQIGQASALAGIVVAAPLAMVQIELPMAVGAAGLVALGLALPLIMSELHFPGAGEAGHETFASMGRTLRAGIAEARASRVVIVLLVVGLLAGAFSESVDRLHHLRLLESASGALPPLGPLPGVTWWALLQAASLVLGIAILGVLRRRVRPERLDRLPAIVAALQAATAIAALAFALAGSFAAAVAAWLLLTGVRLAEGPVQNAWVNQGLDPRVRATVLSMLGQADALGQVAGGPLLGALGRAFGLRAALVAGAGLLLPGIALLLGAARRAPPSERPGSAQRPARD